MHTIILTEPKGYSQKAIAVLGKLGRVYPWPEARGNPAVLKKADILVVKLGLKISKPLLDKLPNLKIIGTSTTGLNHIDMASSKRRGIAVLSLRGETKFLKTIFPTAEETVGLMIMLMRNLPWGFDAVRAGKWQKEKFYGRELAGKTLGIIGFGRLGSMVAKFARALGMQVIACDPYVPALVMRRTGVKRVSIETVFRRADAVSIHVLLSDKTAALVKRRHFRLMKTTAYFINTARGEIVDEKALLEALNKKWIAGAALDVLADEDPRGLHVRHHTLVGYARGHKNLIIVPHLGGATVESMSKTEEFIADKIGRFLSKTAALGQR